VTAAGSGAIHVLAAVDAAHLPVVAVTAASIAATAVPARPLVFHLLYTGTESALSRRLAAYRAGPLSVDLRPVANPFETLGTRGAYPPATLLRLAAPVLLPELERVIYLDSDVIAAGPLDPLFDTDLGGAAIAAAPDLGAMVDFGNRTGEGFRGPGGVSFATYLRETLGVTDGRPEYFNTGVLLMDLAALRRIGFARAAATIAPRVDGHLPLRDQDMLNVLMRGRIMPLSPAWNLMVWFLTFRRPRIPGLAERRRQLRRDARLIHFSGGSKPWHGAGLPFDRLWWEHARRSVAFDEVTRLRRSASAWRRFVPPLPALHRPSTGLAGR
jgi:lipopolysaccharide biosynthesis glycosyltransferase